jgi:molybdopterin-guanine dinucleotide biosynthesis protein A
MGTDKLRLRGPEGGLLIAKWFEQLSWPDLPRLILPPGGVAPDEVSHWPVAHDAEHGEGPLRGVAAALACVTQWACIVAIDTPGIRRAQIDWLTSHIGTDAIAGCWMMRRPSGLEPLPLLIHRDMGDVVSERLRRGRRSLHGLAEEPQTRIVDTPADWPESVWQNLNRPEDLAAWRGSH